MHYNYVIDSKVLDVITNFYSNVASKFWHTYSFDLMVKNISDAYDAIYEIECNLQRRKPTLRRWRGYDMASYVVNGKTRWNYAYRIEGNTIYVEDACHAQNISEFSPSSSTVTARPQYRRIRKKPLFGYTYVMNSNREYNLLDSNNRLVTQWFRAIRPLRQPYGKYRIMAYINIDGWCYALGYDGTPYNMERTWNEAYTENIRMLDTYIDKVIITEGSDNKEIFKTKKIGNYTVIDGEWMIMRPKGLEMFERVQDVRMYDNDL